MTFATRQLLRAFPWGVGAGQLPYTPSGTGGFDDAAPSVILPVGGSRFWLLDPVAGRFVIVDTSTGWTSIVDLRVGLPEAWRKTQIYAYGVARTDGNEIAVVAGGRPAGSMDFTYLLIRFTPSGQPKSYILLDQAAWQKDTPERLYVAADGALWLGMRRRTVVLDSAGKYRVTIPESGVLLQSGSFLADGESPRLFDGQGNPIADISVPQQSDRYYQFIAAGPDDVLLTPVDPETVPGTLQAEVELYQVVWLSPTDRKLLALELVAVPARSLQSPRPGELGDAMPLRSWFPERGMAFTDGGHLAQVELTPKACRIYLLRRLVADESWTAKFSRPTDMTEAEMELLRDEYLTRLGLLADRGRFFALFKNMVWLTSPPESRDPRLGTAEDPILRRLIPANATRH